MLFVRFSGGCSGLGCGMLRGGALLGGAFALSSLGFEWSGLGGCVC